MGTLLESGTKVHVEFDGQVYGNQYPGNWISVLDDDGIIHKIWPKDAPARPVHTVSEPANWPPEPGDVWEAKGYDYVTYNSLGETALYPAAGIGNGRCSYVGAGSGYGYGKGLPDFKALAPTLVHRRNA
jgi:hypothetical protein